MLGLHLRYPISPYYCSLLILVSFFSFFFRFEFCNLANSCWLAGKLSMAACPGSCQPFLEEEDEDCPAADPARLADRLRVVLEAPATLDSTLLTKLTMALAGWSGSSSAKRWHWLCPDREVGFLATNPKILASPTPSLFPSSPPFHLRASGSIPQNETEWVL